MSKHTKRSHALYVEVLVLAQKLLGVHDKIDIKRAVELLINQTTDSQCMIKAGVDEPVFVLRAKDPIARLALAQWIVEAEKAGLHKDKLGDAKDALREFMAWKG